MSDTEKFIEPTNEVTVYIDPCEEPEGVSPVAYERLQEDLRDLLDTIREVHDEEHPNGPQRWCEHRLCRAVEDLA